MANRIIEIQHRLQQKYPGTHNPAVGAGLSRHLSGVARANGPRPPYAVVPNVRTRAWSIAVDFDVPCLVPGLKSRRR